MIMIILLHFLEKIPYKTSFGLSLADVLKVRYYHSYGKNKSPERCICGGVVTTATWQLHEDDVSWETACRSCDFVFDED
jgi:hypothetical protein